MSVATWMRLVCDSFAVSDLSATMVNMAVKSNFASVILKLITIQVGSESFTTYDDPFMTYFRLICGFIATSINTAINN